MTAHPVAPGVSLRSSEPDAMSLAHNRRLGLVGIPPAIQQLAAREVLAQYSGDLGHPTPPQEAQGLVIVLASVLGTHKRRSLVIDPRSQSCPGRRRLT